MRNISESIFCKVQILAEPVVCGVARQGMLCQKRLLVEEAQKEDVSEAGGWILRSQCGREDQNSHLRCCYIWYKNNTR